MASKLVVCVLSSELPLDGSAQRVVTSGLPGIDFALQKLRRWDSAIQALAAEDADLDLCHVEPTRMLGCVVEAHSAQQRAGRTLAQYVLEALSEVDVQVVQHEVRAGPTKLSKPMRVDTAPEGEDIAGENWSNHEQKTPPHARSGLG